MYKILNATSILHASSASPIVFPKIGPKLMIVNTKQLIW